MQAKIEKLSSLYYNFFDKEYENVELIHMDNEKLIVEDKNLNIRLPFFWVEDINNLINEDDKFEEIDLFWFLIRNANIEDKNLLKYHNKGFYKKSYCEFLFRYDMANIEQITKNFKINRDIEIEISNASDFFKLLFVETIEADDAFVGWDKTIKLKGVNKNNFEIYMQEILFVIGFEFPSYFTIDYPEVNTFIREDGNEIYNSFYQPDKFEDIKEEREFEINDQFTEVFSFYNAGVKIASSELSFIYFYKVLEYFFIYNRKDEINTLITNENNMDKLISDLTKIYREDEQNCLTYLLEKNSTKDEVNKVVNFAYNNNIINENSIETFSDELYRYRNSIVHGKNDTRFDLKIPSITEEYYDTDWYKIIVSLSLIYINHFCFNDNLDLKTSLNFT